MELIILDIIRLIIIYEIIRYLKKITAYLRIRQAV